MQHLPEAAAAVGERTSLEDELTRRTDWTRSSDNSDWLKVAAWVWQEANQTLKCKEKQSFLTPHDISTTKQKAKWDHFIGLIELKSLQELFE